VRTPSGRAPAHPQLYYLLKGQFTLLFADLEKTMESVRRSGNPGTGKYAIPMDTDNEVVQRYLKRYTEGDARPVIKKALERSGRYRAMIVRILREYNLPEELVYLPVVESLYNINDVSRAGAVGLWQLMPERARYLGLKVNYWIDERKDPEKSTRAAARYLKELYIMFDDWHLALAAYNRGEFGLVRDLQFSKATNIEQMKNRGAVPKETGLFVPQFIACTLIGDNYREYGFDLRFEEPVPYDRAVIDKIIDLKVIAECVHSTIGEIRELNPALRAWCTPHNYPGFELLVPAGTKAMFERNIAQVKELNPSMGFIKYKVARGDCLSTIARKFHTTSAAIREDNRIRDPRNLRVNQTLVIRPGRKYMEK
jgi:membrane-bound lytic murein transglycosylase D